MTLFGIPIWKIGWQIGKRWIVLASLLLTRMPLWGQEDSVFRTDTSLALVRFQVVHNDAYVLNLKPEDIQLLEDGKPRKISVLEDGAASKRPVDLALLFDISGSVMNAGLLNPLVFKSSVLDGTENVRLAVYGFSDDLKRFCRPTRDMAVLEGAFRALGERTAAETIVLKPPPKRSGTRPGSWIYEAVIAAARDVMPKPQIHSTGIYDPAISPSNQGRQDAAAAPELATAMMLVFSDGFATTSAVPEDASSVCQELGISAYPVVLGHQHLLDLIQQAQENSRVSKGDLNYGANVHLMKLQAQQTEIQNFGRMGVLTGGQVFDLLQINLDIIRKVLDFIVRQIRHQYVAGFVPGISSSAPRSHKLEVRLADKNVGRILGGTRTLVH